MTTRPVIAQSRLASLVFALALLGVSAGARASQKTRDAKAQALYESGVAKYKQSHAADAKTDLSGCIKQKPSKPLLALCYRNLGIVEVGLGDKKSAVATLKKYLPMCVPEECDKVKDLIANLSK